jgi:hypothetical protein
VSSAVTVNPSAFELVSFEAPAIEQIASELATAVGLPDDVEVEINVDEAMIVAKATTRIEGRKVIVDVSGGAFEDLKRARQFSAERTRTVLAHALIRAKDRLDPSFGDPPSDGELTVQLESAWATYAEGRLERLGVPSRPQRRIYHFRIRHGFTDTSDRVFNELWAGEGLRWADIERLSAEAAASKATVPAG